MENIYQSVKEAVEALNEPVQVHKMYLTHRRNGKKLVDFALGIAIVGNSGPVVVSSLRSDDAAAALSLNAAAINAWGHPMPSDELPLSSLETQTSVQDDYLQHVEILPQYIRAYNSRLTMANLSIRHTGYTLSHVIVPGKTAYRVAWVLYYLRTAEGESIVKTAFPNDKTLWDTCLNYLYYPDSRCYKAVVGVAGKKGDVVRYLSFDMEASSGLVVQGLVVTRPLKVSDYDVMKTVYKVFERGKIRPGHIQQALWGSRDLWHWNLVGSSTREFLTGMAGSPYTYFRIALWGKMAQDEIIHRITLDYREKYVGRQRANNEAEG